MSSNNTTLTVGFPLYEDCTLLDFAGATQVFAPFAGAGFKAVWLAADMRPVATTEGVSVMPNYPFALAPPLDVLFVPGGGGGLTKVMTDPVFIGEIQRLAEPAQWVGSICTGAFILAAAGLLNGHEATTYWSQLANLALFPEITVDQDSYPRDLIKDGVFTGGGISSSIDLALNLVEVIRDKATSERAQLTIQYAPSPPNQSGDPSEAPPAITAEVRHSQEGFTEAMHQATLEVLARS